MASQESHHLLEWHFTELNHSSFNIIYAGRGLALILIFFSIIIIAVFFLYLRSVCFSRRAASTASRKLSGLDAATIDSLPIFLHRSSGISTSTGSEQSECSICLGYFLEEEKLKVLPECQHAYHSDCVDMWLTQQSSCPLCRASLIPVVS